MKLPKTGDLLLGKYLLEKRLGEGGMGVVYTARHELLDQRVAVKLIRPSYAVQADAVRRFINEARAAARIESAHVARVLDVGMLDDGLPYMVLEYLDGVDLAEALAQRGPLPVADVADYMLQAIEAIAHAHALGIIHRDLKPSNIFLARRSDGTSLVKVLDFGISKIMGEASGSAGSITETNTVLGSPCYMSPEQLRDAKSVDQRADLWALGVVAYELLTGQLPFHGDTVVKLFLAIQESEPERVRKWRPDVSEELEAIILRCLRRAPDERFASVTELGSALAPFGSGIAVSAYESSKRILPIAAVTSPSSPGMSVDVASGKPLPPTLDAPPPKSETFDPPVSSTMPGLPLAGRPSEVPPAQVVSGGARTDEPWSSSHPGASSSKPRKRKTDALGLALVASLAVVAWLVVTRVLPEHRVIDPVAGASATSGVTASVAAATAAPSTVAVVSAPVTTSPPSSQAAPARRGGAAPDRSPSARPPASAAAPPPPPAKGPATGPGSPACTPPYDIDANGAKKWRMECL